MARSKTIKAKLDSLFAEDSVVKEAAVLLKITNAPGRFDSQRQFEGYLTEGALLNINKIASKALSIPSGEYMVWLTDVGHTMLVPTSGKTYNEVFEDRQDEYEVVTPQLTKHWNKIQMVVESGEREEADKEGEEYDKAPEDIDHDDYESHEAPEGELIRSRIDTTTVDRPPILRAMEDKGFTVTSLAQEVGVQPPAISRLLRTPKNTQGDPGGRNPSVELAAKISKALRVDPTALFPDIFGTAGQTDLSARSGNTRS